MAIGQLALQFFGHTVLAKQCHTQLRAWRKAYPNPHSCGGRIFTGLYAFDAARCSGNAARNKVLVYYPLKSFVSEIFVKNAMIIGLGYFFGENHRRKIALLHMLRYEMLFVGFANVTHAFIRASAIRIIGAYQYTIGGIFKIKASESVVIGFEICTIALSIYYTEIGFHAEWFGQREKQLLKIVYRSASTQSYLHHHTLFIHILGTNGVVFEIIRCGVHDGETFGVIPHPSLTVKRITCIVKSHMLKHALAGRSALHLIILFAGVAMFPQKRSTVESFIGRYDSRCASKCCCSSRK